MTPTLPPALVDRFRTALGELLGLRLDADAMPALATLLAARLRRTGKDQETYLERTLPTLAELGEVARSLSVTESYFLRNREQFQVLGQIARAHAAASAEPLRVLSAGCSTGEEPYSLAIVLRQALPSSGAVIRAFDVNPDALAIARAASYTAWSLRDTPPDVQSRYLARHGKRFVLAPDIRDAVRFEHRNLVAPDPAFWAEGAFHVVFCRNVLMYLQPEVARRVVARIARALTPGGALFLGHAETLRGLSRDFDLCDSGGAFYYRRRGERREAPKPRADEAWYEAIERSSGRVAELVGAPVAPTPALDLATAPDGIALARALHRQERFLEALGALDAIGGDEDADTLLLRAVLEASSARPQAAMDTCHRLLALDDLNAGAHYVLGLCHEQEGAASEAVAHHRKAAYLDSGFAMPRLQLGLLARRNGDVATATRQLDRAAALLATEDSARVLLFGGGFSRQALAALCRAGRAGGER